MPTQLPCSIYILLAILAADKQAKQKGRGGPTIQEASQILFDLQEQGLLPEEANIALRRVPRGFYSSDVDEAFSGYSLTGWGTFRGHGSSNDPLAFNEAGLRRVWSIFGEYYGTHSKEMRPLVDFLKL